MIAAGVGVVALLLGWVVGRSGGSDETATAPEPTTVETTTPATEPDIDPSETIAAIEEPQPSVSWPPVARQRNATDLVANGATITTTPVEIDPRLDGHDLRLVALDGTDIAELDLGGGTVIEYALDGLPRSLGASLVAGDEWIVVPMYDGIEAFVVFDDGTVRRADVAPDGGQVFNIEGTDRFWRLPSYFSGGGFDLQEIGLDGEPTGRTIALPSNVWPAFADPQGGVIVQSSGRWFTVDENGSEALGVGDVVAIDESTLVLNDCVAIDECGLWRIDRESGSSVRVPIDLDVRSRFLPAAWWSGDAGAGLSPDGRWLVTTVEVGAGGIEVVVIDLLTGSQVELEAGRPGPPSFVWTADSRFVISLSPKGTPTAYDVTTGEMFDVVPDGSVVGWNSLTSRP